MKNMKELPQDLAQRLELPEEALLGALKLTVTGGRQALVENHRGLLDYSEERILISAIKGKLAISGTGIPVTTTDVRLTATFENGAYVVGESNIFGFKKQQDCRIDHVELLPAHPKALPDALDAIAAADLILLGPGSLYTSIIPNLLVDGVAEAIAASDAQKIYVCNIMTQDGETEGYTAADHLAALLRHGTADMVELCLANSSPIPPELAERYRAEGAEVLTVDRERIAQMGIELVERPLASPSGDFARHDPDALASAVLDIYRARAVHIYGGRESYRIEK